MSTDPPPHDQQHGEHDGDLPEKPRRDWYRSPSVLIAVVVGSALLILGMVQINAALNQSTLDQAIVDLAKSNAGPENFPRDIPRIGGTLLSQSHEGGSSGRKWEVAIESYSEPSFEAMKNKIEFAGFRLVERQTSSWGVIGMFVNDYYQVVVEVPGVTVGDGRWVVNYSAMNGDQRTSG